MTSDRATPARAVLLGLVAAVLGVAAHGEAGGPVVAGPPAVAVVGAVALGTALLGARPHPVARLAAVLAGGQLALHLALPGDAGGHDHHAVDAGAGPGMVAAHLAVAVLVAGGIVHADRALARAARRHLWRVAVWTRLLDGPPPAPAAATPAVARPAPAARVRRAAVGHHPRRGPPSPDRTGFRPVRAATPPRHGRTPSCPHRGPRPPAPTVEVRSPSW
ncbi:hypothetical protein [Actinomycetospora chibensis]|uniref:MFS transporter n=1 Tax=Actinomycetospora chibensis TaxID=663606 RepID=A0ABV9RC39_9PSEU|nr:hypothetical protein [Actinomycetospora chibensis]MDD7927605.1 hypothetical protein [Actinomycetospora chibensis]